MALSLLHTFAVFREAFGQVYDLIIKVLKEGAWVLK